MLTALFDDGARDYRENSPSCRIISYVHLPRIRDSIFDALVTDGYYLHRPDRVRSAYIVGGVVLGDLVLAVGGANVSGAIGIAPLSDHRRASPAESSSALSAGSCPRARITGARTLEKVLGFEDFLGRVEGDRLDRIVKTPELFEKFLPYAMALQVEKKWVQAFLGYRDAAAAAGIRAPTAAASILIYW